MDDGQGMDLIKLTTDKLSSDAVSESVTCSSCGAISLFIGKMKSFIFIQLAMYRLLNRLL